MAHSPFLKNHPVFPNPLTENCTSPLYGHFGQIYSPSKREGRHCKFVKEPLTSQLRNT